MRNIADKFFIFFIHKNFLFCRFLQPLSHLLKIPAKFRKLIVTIYFQNKIKISLFDILSGFL